MFRKPYKVGLWVDHYGVPYEQTGFTRHFFFRVFADNYYRELEGSVVAARLFYPDTGAEYKVRMLEIDKNGKTRKIKEQQ
jgi:hypothetical protein